MAITIGEATVFKPIYIGAYLEGLVTSRPESIIANDAFPILFNAYIWREKIVKKSGCKTIGRLRRKFEDTSITTSTAGVWSFNLFTVTEIGATEDNKSLEVSSLSITIGAVVFTDDGNGVLSSAAPANSGTVNYATGNITLTHTGGTLASTATFNYFPTLPVMGISTKETYEVNNEETIIFDTIYAYVFETDGYREFIPGTTWTGEDSSFFWTTNYFQNQAGTSKLFWATNFEDPIMYVDGVTWNLFEPLVDAAQKLLRCRCLVPFRSRLVAFNTVEGETVLNGVRHQNRIRWGAVGSPLPTTLYPEPWRSQSGFPGGFIDIPTAEAIISVGYVRDNLVVFCERSTWQLRFTGQVIQPFIIEKVNTELGSESTFSVIPFEKSVAAFGATGINMCDGFSSTRIDIKIPDLVFEVNNKEKGPERVWGIRDYINRLAYWTYPYVVGNSQVSKFPNRRVIYNYENESWATFYDSFTALGTTQIQEDVTWDNDDVWEDIGYSWVNTTPLIPQIVGGTQMGFIMQLDEKTNNDPTLSIIAITSDGVNPTQLTVPDHNLDPDSIITLSGIPIGTDYAKALNNPKGGLISGITQAVKAVVTSSAHSLSTGDILVIDAVVGMTQINGLETTITVLDDNSFSCDNIDSTTYTAYTSSGDWLLSAPNCFLASIDELDPTKLNLYKYDPQSGQFSVPQTDASGVYIGGGQVAVRDNFIILSKKFNFLNEGQTTRVSRLDLLAKSNEQGEISIYTYSDYESYPSNIKPLNVDPKNNLEDPLFNSKIPLAGRKQGEVAMQRVSCPTYGTFFSFAWTFSNEQMNSNKSDTPLTIEGHIIWVRPSGKQLNRV